MSAPPIESFDSLSDAQVLDGLRAIESDRRELEQREAALLGQVRTRSLAFVHGCKNDVDFLRHLLTIGAHDAAGRVKLAAAVNPRRSPVGELLPPEHPEAAGAFTAGAICGGAALTIAQTVDRLPADNLDLENGAGRAVETVLVDFARDNDPETLRRHAKAVATALDQDGAFRDAEHRDRTRDLSLRRRADGSGTLTGDLTCELAEVVETVLDCLGKLQPGPDDQRDPRTPGQRRHDALLTGLRLLLGSGRLPSTMGCATTVLLTMEVGEFATGAGVARTGHGYPIPPGHGRPRSRLQLLGL
jgi:hypothetical protein